jgi:hypothetical protein
VKHPSVTMLHNESHYFLLKTHIASVASLQSPFPAQACSLLWSVAQPNARFALYWLTDLKAPMNEVITLVVIKLKPDNTPAFQF